MDHKLFKWSSGDINISYARAVLKTLGFEDSDFDRPVIGVVNSWSEVCPGHVHLRELSTAVKAGIWQAGGTPVEFNVLSQCAAICAGQPEMRYDTPSRDIIAAEIEIGAKIHELDGIAILTTCDKNVPAALLAAARLDLPSIIVPGGPMLPGYYEGKKYYLSDLDEYVFGGITINPNIIEVVRTLEDVVCPTFGACPVMGTANTMQCLSEAVGLALPYSSTTPAISSMRLRIAKKSGKAIVELTKRNITSRKILTENSLKNMCHVLMALGGSTNAIVHILALAYELGLEDKINLDLIENISQRTPCLTPIRPIGPYDLIDLHEAGGIPAVLKELGNLIDAQQLTVSGERIGEIANKAVVKKREVIRTRSEPFHEHGGIAILRGNLAKSSVVRVLAIRKELWHFRAPALVFDSQEEALNFIRNKKIQEQFVMVVRYEGPRGGPGLTDVFPIVLSIVGKKLDTTLAVVTDGKVSGFARGPFVCQVTPEAAIGGPIALIKDGDIIEIDIKNRKLSVELSDAELERRKKDWQPPKRRIDNSILTIYSLLANQADKGAGLPIRFEQY
jgi:dihydroxy-acid dehydratase